MGKELSVKEAVEKLDRITEEPQGPDKNVLGDMIADYYFSDELSKWRYDKEKLDGVHPCDDVIREVIDAWIPDNEKQVALSNALDGYAYRYEDHGFRNGVRFTVAILRGLLTI